MSKLRWARVAGLCMLALAGCDDGSNALPDAQVSPDAEVYPPATRLFIAGALDSQVHVFDLETLERVTTIAVPSRPGEVHATRDGSAVWTLAQDGAAVAIVDPATLSLRHEVQVGARPTHSFLDPDGARIWVGNDASSDVSIIDLASGAEQRILTGNGHHKMAMVTGDEGALRFVYVSNLVDSTITVLDPTGALVTNVQVGPSPHGMDYAAETGLVYNCSDDEAHSIEVLDPDAGHAVVSRIPLPARCGYLHVEHGAGWATIGSEGLLARIDLEAETVETFEAGVRPDKFAIVGDRAFVANVTEDTVTVVDLSGVDAPRAIAIGAAEVHGEHGHRGMRRFEDRIFVPNEHDHTVSVIDVETESVIATLEGVMGPRGIAVAGPGIGTAYPR